MLHSPYFIFYKRIMPGTKFIPEYKAIHVNNDIFIIKILSISFRMTPLLIRLSLLNNRYYIVNNDNLMWKNDETTMARNLYLMPLFCLSSLFTLILRVNYRFVWLLVIYFRYYKCKTIYTILRVAHVEQELLTLSGYLSSARFLVRFVLLNL